MAKDGVVHLLAPLTVEIEGTPASGAEREDRRGLSAIRRGKVPLPDGQQGVAATQFLDPAGLIGMGASIDLLRV